MVRDYVYFPLGGSKNGLKYTLINTIIVFLVSGFWHGANWTFIFWGALNAILFIPGLLFPSSKKQSKLRQVTGALWTFFLITITWVFFRADTISEAFNILGNSIPQFSGEALEGLHQKLFKDWKFFWVLMLIGTILIEFKGRKYDFALGSIFPKNKLLRWLGYFVIIVLIGFTMQVEKEGFIYFQF